MGAFEPPYRLEVGMTMDMIEVVTNYRRYWVVDNSGDQHLFLDFLAAQLYEDRMRREAREVSVGNNVDVSA